MNKINIGNFGERVNRKLQHLVHKRVAQLPPVGIRIYYRVVGWEFSREFRSVSSGIRHYRDLELSSKDIYHLRRNIHMMEKGLTMRPRREVFALNYLDETVDLFVRTHNEGSELTRLERQWCADVLAEFFVATMPSGNKHILQAFRKCSEILEFHSDKDDVSRGPSTPILNWEDESHVNVDALLKLANNRRSVRWFSDKKVDREMVDKAVAIAIESPTACNRQPYKFLIMDKPETVVPVANIAMGTAGFADQIPGLIAVVGDLSAFFHERDRHLIYIDGCLAAMGLVLGLEAQGIASCVINWPDIPDRERRIRTRLGLAEHEQVIMLIAFGYADHTALTPYSAKKDPSAARFYVDAIRPDARR